MRMDGFDPNDHEPPNFDPFPDGEYKCLIVTTEDRETKRGDGMYLSIEYEVLEGQYRGRKIWENLNLINPSEKAVEIAKGQLSAICRAIGIENLDDTDQLMNKVLVLKLGIKVDEKYGDQNKIKGYFDREGSKPDRTNGEAKPKAHRPPKPESIQSVDQIPF